MNGNTLSSDPQWDRLHFFSPAEKEDGVSISTILQPGNGPVRSLLTEADEGDNG